MGTGKTGSSALQSSFANNKKALADLGIIYADHSMEKDAALGMVTSGNAASLASYLSGKGRKSELNKISSVLTRASKQSKSVLLSSEVFGDYDEASLKQFLAVVDKYDYEIRCIYYVRSICGYALSSYSQRVKRHQYHRTFTGYVRLSFSTPFSRIFGSISAFGKDSVSLYNYDHHREQIDLHFYETVLGLPVKNLSLITKKVNRSMSDPELQFIRTMNKAFSKDSQSRFVSDSLIYAFPNMNSRPRIATKDYEYVCQKFKDELDAINACDIDVPIEFIDESIELCERVESPPYNNFQVSVLAVLAELVKKLNH